ncbi:MAG: hypothetical protein ABS52_07825 [Gemmatimonadetes bacterium SCN 70-22]|nr:MAG: hypothetical protein ABS52_07825 [Gemmatimonadetes bacterium SCN 70-22]
MNPVTLLIWECDQLSLGDAIVAFGATGGRGVVFLSDPFEFRVGALERGAVRGMLGETLDLSHVFEARCLRNDAELRWRQDASAVGGRGRARVLTENVELTLGEPWKLGRPIEAIDQIPCTYLVAGGKFRPSPENDGWMTSSDERWRAIHLPAEATKSGHLQIEGVEYVAMDAEHGNAFVAAERLCGIRGMARDHGRR